MHTVEKCQGFSFENQNSSDRDCMVQVFNAIVALFFIILIEGFFLRDEE